MDLDLILHLILFQCLILDNFDILLHALFLALLLVLLLALILALKMRFMVSKVSRVVLWDISKAPVISRFLRKLKSCHLVTNSGQRLPLAAQE